MKEKYITIQQHNGNKYITVKFYYDSDGIRKVYSKTFNPAEYTSFNQCMIEACNHRDIKRAEFLLSGLPSGVHRTVEQVFNEGLDLYHESQGNRKALRSDFFRIKATYGNKNIDDIRPLDIQSFLNGLVYDVSLNMIKRIAIVWKKICKTAIMLNLITINPMDRVIVPAKSKHVTEPRSQKVKDVDIDKMINYFLTQGIGEEQIYYYHILAYAIMTIRETGIRPAECYALTREDVHIEEGYIHICHSIGSNEYSDCAVVATKTESSVRDIPLNNEGIKVFQIVLGYAKTDNLFADINNKYLSSNSVSWLINRISSRLGISFHLYALRHRFSTSMITNNVDVRTAMELMGHAEPSMTIKYARSDNEKKKDAVNSLKN